MTIDEQIEVWEKECEKMSKSDKIGVATVDFMRPYTILYNLCVIKIESLINKDKGDNETA